MFESLYVKKQYDPMVPCCIVTNSPAMKAWLRHYFVFEWQHRHNKVLANCDFQLFLPFVNDWMDKLLNKNSNKRDPNSHPYSKTNLQWRIYRLLSENKLVSNGFAEIMSYLDDNASPRRQFQLAGRLATLFDDYQVYRCDIISKWESENNTNNWQAELWKMLIADNNNSYSGTFNKMESFSLEDAKSAFDNKYREVAIFGATTMAMPYIYFLNNVMSKVVNINMYVLNPGKGYWLEDVSTAKQEHFKEKLFLEAPELIDDPLYIPEKGHELLCSLGNSLQEYLFILNEQYNQIYDNFSESDAETLLGSLQNEILNSKEEYDQCNKLTWNEGDDSIQIHICHSQRREVEVLYNHLLKWLTENQYNNKTLQPYQIQVLVTDIKEYSPHIDAIFGSAAKTSPHEVPYAIDTHAISAESEILNAFITLCNIVTSRFELSSIFDLLSVESVMTAFDLAAKDLNILEQIIRNGNIRWGLDAEHRKTVANVDMSPYMTWEYGLDRLLMGYAVGENEWLNDLYTSDYAEGAGAIVLGKLTAFIYKLKYYRDNIIKQKTRNLSEWHNLFTELLDTFFVSTENTYQEITKIYQVISDLQSLKKNSGIAEQNVPFEVIITHIEKTLSGTASSGDSLTPNVVTFCQLRTMNSHPAAITCVLGLNDGAFPHKDNRPTFDLLNTTRRRGDRSLRRDDRCAFLESLINARQKIYLSYVGRTDKGDEPMPPSIVLQELHSYLINQCSLSKTTLMDGSSGTPLETLHHLNSIHPDYFDKNNSVLFSYSKEDFLAAKQLIKRDYSNNDENDSSNSPIPTDETTEIELETLKLFFVNPAKYYYQNILGVRLNIQESLLPYDDEPMKSDTLQDYKLKIDLMNEQLPLDEITRVSEVEGAIPLAEAGQEHIRAVADNIEHWLKDNLIIDDMDYGRLKESLNKQSEIQEEAKDLNINLDNNQKRIIHGALRKFAITGHRITKKTKQDSEPQATPETVKLNIQLEARPTNIKAKDKVRAWISHLFACAVAKNENDAPYTVIIGLQNKKELESECFMPLDSDMAKENLQTLITLYHTGQLAPLPFVPETSKAYYTSVDNQYIAIISAVNKWGSNTNSAYGRSEAMDNFMFHAFGENGPAIKNGMVNELFEKTAKAFYKPLFENICNNKDSK